MTSIFSDMPNVQAQQIQNMQTQSAAPQVKVENSFPAAAAKTKSDTVELSTGENKKKKGPIKTIKGFIANVKKAWVNVTEYTKGLVKGVAAGVVAGSIINTAGDVVKKYVKPETKIPFKPLAIAAGVVSVAVGLWNASLDASEKRSDIEHRWTGHNNN